MNPATDSSYDFATPAAPNPPAPASDAPPPETARPAHQRLPERNCPQCGYLIVGKPRQNRCPECRAPLDDSIADRLQFCDSNWIRQASWGALAVALAVPAHIGGTYLAALAGDPVRGSALHVIGAALTLAGIWMITAPEDTRPQRRALLALFARGLAIAATVMWLGATVVASRQGAVLWLMVPALAAMAGEAVAFGLFASGLAARVPHEGLTNQFRNFALLLPGFFGFLSFCLFHDVMAYYQIFFCSFPLLGALAGLLLWVGATLVRFFLELRHAARAADAVVRKHFQAAEAAVRAAAAKAARPE